MASLGDFAETERLMEAEERTMTVGHCHGLDLCSCLSWSILSDEVIALAARWAMVVPGSLILVARTEKMTEQLQMQEVIRFVSVRSPV